MQSKPRICQGRNELGKLEGLMRWRKQSQVVRGLVGQGEEHTGDSKCNWKPLQGSREKWACPDLNICKKIKTSLRQLCRR